MDKPISVPQLHRIPNIKTVDAVPGTAAYEYISHLRSLKTVNDDSRFLGGYRQPYGVLLIFNDGSSVMVYNGIETSTVKVSSLGLDDNNPRKVN